MDPDGRRMPGELMAQLKRAWSSIDSRWGRWLLGFSLAIALIVGAVGLAITIKPCAFLGSDAGDDCNEHARMDGVYLGITLIGSAIFTLWFCFNGIIHESRVEAFFFVAMTLLLTGRAALSTIEFEGVRASKIEAPLHYAIFVAVAILCVGTIILTVLSVREFGYRALRVTGGNFEKGRVYGMAQLFLGFMKLDAQFCILTIAASLLRPMPALGFLRDNLLVAIASGCNLVYHVSAIIGLNNERSSLFVVSFASSPFQLVYVIYRMVRVLHSSSIWHTPQIMTIVGSIATRIGCVVSQCFVWKEFKGVLKTLLAKDDAPQYQALPHGI